MKPYLAITMGDVNGVGPEILAKALCDPTLHDACRPIVLGSAAALEAARRFAPQCPLPHPIDDPVGDAPQGYVSVVDQSTSAPALQPGRETAEAGRCAVEWLQHAVRLAQARTVAGIVTCPISKKGINMAGFRYKGHTQIIAEMTASPDYRMCLFAGGMRVVHITSHDALAVAVQKVRRARIATSIRIGADALQRLRLGRARIAVAGLNPHAGEDSLLGTEEVDEIQPAIEECRGEDIDCSGPYPPDTVFKRMRDGEFDLVVAMYHDQGHIPVKLIAMDEGVNVTLGIPIIRTSVDHGTAYDIAGSGRAREHSLVAAICLAARFAEGADVS